MIKTRKLKDGTPFNIIRESVHVRRQISLKMLTWYGRMSRFYGIDDFEQFNAINMHFEDIDILNTVLSRYQGGTGTRSKSGVAILEARRIYDLLRPKDWGEAEWENVRHQIKDALDAKARPVISIVDEVTAILLLTRIEMETFGSIIDPVPAVAPISQP